MINVIENFGERTATDQQVMEIAFMMTRYVRFVLSACEVSSNFSPTSSTHLNQPCQQVVYSVNKLEDAVGSRVTCKVVKQVERLSHNFAASTVACLVMVTDSFSLLSHD